MGFQIPHGDFRPGSAWHGLARCPGVPRPWSLSRQRPPPDFLRPQDLGMVYSQDSHRHCIKNRDWNSE